MLLLKDSSDLHGSVGSRQGTLAKIALIDEVGFLEMLQTLILVLHAQIKTAEVDVDLGSLDVIGAEHSQTADEGRFVEVFSLVHFALLD